MRVFSRFCSRVSGLNLLPFLGIHTFPCLLSIPLNPVSVQIATDSGICSTKSSLSATLLSCRLPALVGEMYSISPCSDERMTFFLVVVFFLPEYCFVWFFFFFGLWILLSVPSRNTSLISGNASTNYSMERIFLFGKRILRPRVFCRTVNKKCVASQACPRCFPDTKESTSNVG